MKTNNPPKKQQNQTNGGNQGMKPMQKVSKDTIKRLLSYLKIYRDSL